MSLRWRIRLATWACVVRRWECTPARLLPRKEIGVLRAEIVRPLTANFRGSPGEWRAREKLEARCEALLARKPE